MGGFDEHVSIVGDWMPPSPSPRALFSSMIGDERSGTQSVNENRNGYLLPGPTNVEMRSSVADDDETIKSNLMSSRGGGGGGGLLERMAARAGFNAPRLNTESIRPADTRSPYLTIPPGLSPTSLLDSPVFLTSNSLVQPSPTTGKFSFLPSNIGTSMLMTDKENSYEDANGSSFAFQPSVMGPAASFTFGSSSKANYSDNSILPQSVKVPSQDSTLFDHSNNSAAKSTHDMSPEPAMEHSPPLDEPQDDDGDQRINGDPNVGGEDGYNWRKYGQKQVKGSEYPRSYYKCTHASCPVKKKVERSHEGHITEIIYKGAHNHPKPPPNRRCAPGGDAQLETTTTEQPGTGNPDWRWENPDEYGNGKSSTQIESGDGVQGSSTFSNDEDEDDRVTHGSVSLGYDGEGDESESKRRKVETYPPCDISGGATRAIREPRVVVQTTSEVDILDDGYRWRKYGQKVVKGNPNPRSYYKCTSAGCSVRKHVERASHDLKSVITTYEGKHNHDVPAARNSSHLNSHSNSLPTQVGQIHRPEPARLNNNTSLGRSFGSNPNLGFGMNLAMAGFGPGPNQGRLPTHSYFGQPNPMSDAGYMLPKVEPDSDSGLNVYHQIMNRLPM